MTDLVTVMWKEWKEILSWGGHRGKLNLLAIVGAFGIFLPLQMGRAWVESPLMLAYWAWVPLFLVVSVTADSFAGERERHTLETLLASRLSDQAILLGKIGAAVGYGAGITWLSLLVGLATINLAYGKAGKLLLYPPAAILGIVGFCLLGAGLAATAGVLVSLRATTVRQAQQTLSIAILVLLFLLVFGTQLLPAAWKTALAELVTRIGTTYLLLFIAAVLALIDLGLLIAARMRFRRAQLILE
ncbi:MAG: ABC transporter permease [Anaerolineae bacterium]|nr:ABC transporter permease [Anaerolineae bacterium]